MSTQNERIGVEIGTVRQKDSKRRPSILLGELNTIQMNFRTNDIWWADPRSYEVYMSLKDHKLVLKFARTLTSKCPTAPFK